MQVIRRNGAVVSYQLDKISIAITKAFLAVEGNQSVASQRVRDQVATLSQLVNIALLRRLPAGGAVHIEDIQDQVELALMRNGNHDVARAYVLYREKRNAERAAEKASTPDKQAHHININIDGKLRPLNLTMLNNMVEEACVGLGKEVKPSVVVEQAVRDLYDGIGFNEVRKALILSARSLIETEPAYNYVTARLQLDLVRAEVLGGATSHAEMASTYATYFPRYIKIGIEADLLDPRLGQFDLEKLGAVLVHDRDFQFGYLGLQTLYDRYFLHIEERRIELPQIFFMRVAMGLAINEIDREARAIEFYNLLSSFDFMSSTPTLFNSGTLHSQSSLSHEIVYFCVFGRGEGIKENAFLEN